jgi:hypothetical protein
MGVRRGREEGRELGSLETLRENLSDLVTAKLGRPEKSWLTQVNTINDITLLKALYRAILHAKSRKQVKAAFDAALGNGKKAK